jgi:hypothetical protein
MTTKNYRLILCLGLLLHLAGTPVTGTPVFSADPPLTGITIDEELTQLLKQIVPYSGNLPVEKRFMYNLNKLLNEDLKEQNEKYKLAAAKLALRMALAINKTVDSIEVRWDWGDRRIFSLGGVIEDSTQWDESGDLTNYLFSLKEGKIAKVRLDVSVGACGGQFCDCCDRGAYPPGVDDAWRQHLVDLGRLEGFSFNTADDIAKIVRMHEKSGASIETLDLRHKILAEGIADLAKLKGVKHLIIDTTPSRDGKRETEAMREAFFDLLPKLPELQTLEMATGQVTETQIHKLAECQNLTVLTLSQFSIETPPALTLLNRLKKLEKLVLASGYCIWELQGADRILTDTTGGTAPPHAYFRWLHNAFDLFSQIDADKPLQAAIEFCDLPNLTFFYAVGVSPEHPFSFANLPSLTFLLTDAPKIQGDILTERIPPNLRVLMGSGRGITEEHVRHISSLEHLRALGLYAMEPADIFSSLKNAKNLKWLSLAFAKDGILSPPSMTLSALMVRFPNGGEMKMPTQVEVRDNAFDHVLDENVIYSGGLRWPTHVEVRRNILYLVLDVENVTFIGEMPACDWVSVRCRNTTMSYSQFRSFFQNRANYIGYDLRFDGLTLTDLPEGNLFTGFNFPVSLQLHFSPGMRESLKGRTLDFVPANPLERINSLKLTVPDPQEVEIRTKDIPFYDFQGKRVSH